MRIVFDTNVLIAAFIANGACAELVKHCAGRHEMVVSRFILEEFERKLFEKFDIPTGDVRAAIELILLKTGIVEPADVGKVECRDPKDVPILGTAIAGGCTCIITGDRDLLDLGRFREIDIISPSDFWKYEARLSFKP